MFREPPGWLVAAVLVGCAMPGAPQLVPSEVPVGQLTATPLQITGLAPSQFLAASSGDLVVVDDYAITIAGELATVSSIDVEGATVSLATELPIGVYSMQVTASGSRYDVADALTITSGAPGGSLVPRNGLDRGWLAGTAAITIDRNVNINGDSGAISGVRNGGMGIVDGIGYFRIDAQGQNAVPIAVFVFDELTVLPGIHLTVTGPRAVAILARGVITIDGTIDASAAGARTAPGPGGGGGGKANSAAGGCGPGGSGQKLGSPGDSGGGGGGGGRVGGNGGASTSPATAPGIGGLACVPATLVPLVGGGGGGAGAALAVPGPAEGGGGGGALQITSLTAIRMTGATIAASGRGGEGGRGNATDGGSGAAGGAGGGILLEALEITLSASNLIVNGGGGGGAGTFASGGSGTDGGTSTTAAAGGAGDGAVGGAGGAGGTGALAASPGQTNGGGGGGGGAAGVVAIYARTFAGTPMFANHFDVVVD